MTGSKTAVLVLILVGHALLCWVIRTPDNRDFVELWLETRTALSGGSPYSNEAVSRAYAEHFAANGIAAVPPATGFIYPPALIAVLAPLSTLPVPIAYPLWWGVLTALAVTATRLLVSIAATGGWVFVAATGVLLFHTVTQSAMLLGQTALLPVAGVAVGVAAWRAGRPVLSAVGWSLCAVKPQIGLPLLLVAWADGGVRLVVLALAGMGGLTVAGAALTGDPVSTLRDYFPHASQTIYTIDYNRVINSQVLSWNRFWYLATGREVNLPVTGMVAGYAVLGGAFLARSRLGSVRGGTEYWLAVAAVTALVAGQSKGYDLVLLVLWLPHLVAAWRAGRRSDVIAFLAVLLVLAIPLGVVSTAVSRLAVSPALAPAILSYRGWGVIALTVYLLIRGPVRTPPTPTPA
jgi:hypothetical protein